MHTYASCSLGGVSFSHGTKLSAGFLLAVQIIIRNTRTYLPTAVYPIHPLRDVELRVQQTELFG